MDKYIIYRWYSLKCTCTNAAGINVGINNQTFKGLLKKTIAINIAIHIAKINLRIVTKVPEISVYTNSLQANSKRINNS